MTGIGARDPTTQLAVLLALVCGLIGVRALVLAARDGQVADLSPGFFDHRRLAAVTDLAHARWAALSRLEQARIGHILALLGVVAVLPLSLSRRGRPDRMARRTIRALYAGTRRLLPKANMPYCVCNRL